MSTTENSKWDLKERRKPNSNRRKSDRRSYQERRSDRRVGGQGHRRSFYGWLRSLVKARLGVDRRKNPDRRKLVRDRRAQPGMLVSKEELRELLK